MTQPSTISVFGEVLFDCFPGGERILGGAPFNVAWHLQALGDRPRFISGVGEDELGREILQAMADWGMATAGVQVAPGHPTGRVEVRIVDREPRYAILPDCAYDFIAAEKLAPLPPASLLYHGTLGLRSAVSRAALSRLAQSPELSIFLDVNLRPPWWSLEEVCGWLARARWVKLNQEELGLLGFAGKDLPRQAASFRRRFELEQLILTRGEQGALVCTGDGECHSAPPEPVARFVDTVGAGDAFTALYLHGLLAGWSLPQTLELAQRFAGKVIGLRGATTTDPGFYREFVAG